MQAIHRSWAAPRVLLAGMVALIGCADAVRAPSTGGVTIEIAGLPAGANAAISIAGPDGYRTSLGTSRTLSDLRPGDYTLTASDVTAGGVEYGAVEQRQVVTVSPGAVRLARIEYLNVNTALTVRVSGLPAEVQPVLRLVGPGGFERVVTRTERLLGLAEGKYVVLGSGVVIGDSTYQPSPVRQEYIMTGTYPGQLTVTYSAVAPRSLNLQVAGVYFLNAVQTASGSIPLIEGREAFLRIFATASEENAASPWARVRLYHGSSLVRTLDVPPGSSSVPRDRSEGKLESSWNARVPGELVIPGLRVEVELDPENAVIESDETDNRYPASGVPLDVAVIAAPPLRVRFVPIVQSQTGSLGGITPATMPSFLRMTRKVYPLGEVEADVRAPYVWTGPVLDREGGGWVPLLNELAALRVAEGGAGVHYMGIVRVGYTSGVAGMAFIPGRPVLGGAGVAWDYLPSGSEVVAHELGHNFGRSHAPCGVSGDPEYPYPEGAIGVFGYDLAAGTLRIPTDPDLMGYCPNPWISDHNYEGVLRFRALAAARATSSSPQSTVLVWGRIADGQLVLEPAFLLDARPSLPASGGPYAVQGFDREGNPLFSISFSGEPVADSPGSERVFAFAVPISSLEAAQLASLRLSGDGREASIRAAVGPDPGAQSVTATQGAAGVLIQWDARAHPMALVRDAGTGEILAFARGGRVSVPGPRGGTLDVVVSNGIRSTARRVPVRPN